MDKLFKIDFYPQEWLVSTGMLTPEERGVYIQIIALIYAKMGPIDNDAAWIGNASNCSSRLAKSIIKSLIEKQKIYIIDGKLSQKRTENELKIKRTRLEKFPKTPRKDSEKQPENNKNNNLTQSKKEISLPPLSLSLSLEEERKKDIDVVKGASVPQVALSKAIAEIMGWDKNPNWFGDFSRIESWLNAGWNPELDILPTVKKLKAGKANIKTLKYFEQAIADHHASRLSPTPKGNPNGTPSRQLTKRERANIALDKGIAADEERERLQARAIEGPAPARF